MIIGNNSNNQPNYNSNFNERFNTIKHNNEQNHDIVNMRETIKNMNHSNINNTNEMKEKAFAMLQDRLSNGTISLEEFNKKCRAIGKIEN